MPVTKVRSKWVSGDLVFETLTGTEIIRILGDGTFKVNEILLDAATLDELALLGGLTASVAELNLLDGSVAGTVDSATLSAALIGCPIVTRLAADTWFEVGRCSRYWWRPWNQDDGSLASEF